MVCLFAGHPATEPVFPRNRLLRVDRLTLNLLATAAILRPSDERKNAIASSIDPMVVASTRREVVSMTRLKACIQRGCALTREAFYCILPPQSRLVMPHLMHAHFRHSSQLPPYPQLKHFTLPDPSSATPFCFVIPSTSLNSSRLCSFPNPNLY